MNKPFKIIGLTAIGGALEFYDFTIYALFSSYLSHHFFPNTDPLVALINTFAVFALGYLARPLGGIVFGHIGDRLGRRTAFSLAIFLMAVATLLIGALPSYQSIGLFAPLALIGLRLVQGFSVGGEIPGATVFTLEHIPAAHRGFAVGIIFMFITLGNTLGAGVGLFLTNLLSTETMMAWGWRIPFILGFALGIICFIIRIKLEETPAFIAILNEKKISHIPLWELVKTARKNLLIGFLLTAISASTISFFLYLPTYLSSMLHLKISHAYLINFIAFFVFAVMTAFFGWLSDHTNRKIIMLTGAILLIASIHWLFNGLGIYGNDFIWVFILFFAVLAGMLNGCYAVTIAELFPTHLRYSGMGLSYSLGLAIFGGLAPLCFTYLIKVSADVKAPSYYLLGCAVFTLIAVLSRRKTTIAACMN